MVPYFLKFINKLFFKAKNLKHLHRLNNATIIIWKQYWLKKCQVQHGYTRLCLVKHNQETQIVLIFNFLFKLLMKIKIFPDSQIHRTSFQYLIYAFHTKATYIVKFTKHYTWNWTSIISNNLPLFRNQILLIKYI